MPTGSDSARLNLEFYKKQSKALLKTAQSKDAAALARIARHTNPNNEPLALHHAQLTIAREQGFPSWPKFQSFIKQSQLDFQGQVAAFIDAATSDHRRAESLLAQHPQIAHAGFYVALVLGDHLQVAQAVSDNPALAKEKSGPQNCEPLLYVCFSRYANPRNDQSRAAALTETAGILLGHGANADAVILADDPPHSPLSCLYGASGLNNNLALTEVLLNAGANPNDNESLYHSTEHEDLACMRLLLARGARPAGTNALKHMLDRDDLQGLRSLRAAGADPNETNGRGETALHWAISRGRSTPIIAALLDAGTDVNAQRNDGRTAYSLAVLGCRTETIELLKSRGADTRLSPLDQFVQSCAQATPAELDRILATRPDFSSVPNSGRLLPDLAVSHSTQAVRALLAAGVAIDSRGEWGATALHWACWKGYADIVKLLLDHGAPLTIEDEQFHATPSGWFSHGVQNCEERQGNYPEVARLLITAKAKFATTDVPTGNREVDAIFRANGLL
jgi:ankyrin repeat protein